MKLLNFILSHSIFVSFCAVALCFQTAILFHLKVEASLYCLVFFASLCGYNFYWVLSNFYFHQQKLSPAFLQKNKSFIIIFSIGFLGLVISFNFLENITWFILPALMLTLIYSLPVWPFSFAAKLQKIGFFKTTLLAFTWAYVTVVIPAHHFFITNVKQLAIMLAARFCFMLLLCIIFDMRDVAIDKLHGLHSLATDVDAKKLSFIIYCAFFFYFITGFIIRIYFFESAQIIAFAIVGVVLWLMYKLSLQKRGYIFYYFFVDGLMLFSALATYLAWLW